jgi:type IV pilus modification protein PilV
MNRFPHRRALLQHRQAGFALIEALVAFLVVSFGMLAIAGMQTTLARSSDLAKQRSEAVRLAQVKMEQLRSFDEVATGQGTYNYATDVASGSDAAFTPANSSTAYTRSWTVTAADGTTTAGANDAQKWIHVRVQWADRTSTALNQSVNIDSVIARNNPGELKGLFAGQAPPKVRKPKNRNLNIPYPAVGTSDPNRSVFIPPPGTVAYVFDNDTGNIVQSCTGISALVEGIDVLAAATAGGGSCTNLNAYLLSGYVRVYDKVAQPAAGDIENTNDPTVDLDSSAPLTISSSTSWAPSAHTCYAQRQKVMSASNVQPATITSMTRASGVVTVTTSGNHGYPVGVLIATEGLSNFTFEGSFEIVSVPSSTTLTYLQPGPDASVSTFTAASKIKLIQQITLAESDPVPAGYTGQPLSTFIVYACIVTPVDDDNDINTPAAWWGRVDLVPSSSWAIGTNYSASPKEYRVCRYSGDYSGASGTNSVSNAEHPLYYRRVNGALDSQNFLLVRGGQSCPGDAPIDFAAGNFFNSNSVQHQPSGVVSYQCLNSACNGASKVAIEPSTATGVVPMF